MKVLPNSALLHSSEAQTRQANSRDVAGVTIAILWIAGVFVFGGVKDTVDHFLPSQSIQAFAVSVGVFGLLIWLATKLRILNGFKSEDESESPKPNFGQFLGHLLGISVWVVARDLFRVQGLSRGSILAATMFVLVASVVGSRRRLQYVLDGQLTSQ